MAKFKKKKLDFSNKLKKRKYKKIKNNFRYIGGDNLEAENNERNINYLSTLPTNPCHVLHDKLF